MLRNLLFACTRMHKELMVCSYEQSSTLRPIHVMQRILKPRQQSTLAPSLSLLVQSTRGSLTHQDVLWTWSFCGRKRAQRLSLGLCTSRTSRRKSPASKSEPLFQTTCCITAEHHSVYSDTQWGKPCYMAKCMPRDYQLTTTLLGRLNISLNILTHKVNTLTSRNDSIHVVFI